MYRPPSQSSNPPSRGGLGAIGAQVLADYNIPIGNRPVSHNNPRGFHWIPDTYIPYKNIKPRTRIERKALIDKETLEKQRLANVYYLNFLYQNFYREVLDLTSMILKQLEEIWFNMIQPLQDINQNTIVSIQISVQKKEREEITCTKDKKQITIE